jgi:predicted amidohydrolase YtcJ
MQADLMILEQNPLAVDPHDVASIKIRTVYKSGVAVIG